MELLTEKQQKVFAFIEARLRAGDPPSQREIARHFRLAQNAVYQLVGYLKKKGYLADSGGHRGLRLSKEYLDEKRRTEGIPVVGRVAAGEPILAQENIDEYANLKELLGLPADAFLLKVSGESMIDEGIMDGGYVAVRPSKTIENGSSSRVTCTCHLRSGSLARLEIVRAHSLSFAWSRSSSSTS